MDYLPPILVGIVGFIWLFIVNQGRDFTIDDIQEKEGDEFHIKVTFHCYNAFKKWQVKREYRILDNGRIYSYPKAVEVDEHFHRKLNQKFLQEVWSVEEKRKVHSNLSDEEQKSIIKNGHAEWQEDLRKREGWSEEEAEKIFGKEVPFKSTK